MSKKKDDGQANKNEEPVLESAEAAAEEACGGEASYKALADEYMNKVQRVMAEFDNFRKRTVKEKASMYDDGVRDTVLQILPVIDNFERALLSTANKDDGLYKGLEMVLKQFAGILEVIGVSEIPALGKQFDPALHAAVSHEDDETQDDNTVAEVLMKGYMFKDKVIRHSMVKVVN